MDMEEKVSAVESVFQRLDAEIAGLQLWSGMRCQWGCGKCCYKPDIEATILEFLPFAFHLYKNNETLSWLQKVKDNPSTLCLILDTSQLGAGLCSQYAYRGLICRLFGYSARTNKYGKKELVTCSIIKESQPENVSKVTRGLEEGTAIPVMSDYYMQLHAIDFELTREFFPINEAIKRAIESILHYYAYRT